VRKVIVSTGYYDLPNLMGVPGEHLSKVMHYYKEPHPYYDTDVVVIGARTPLLLPHSTSGATVRA